MIRAQIPLPAAAVPEMLGIDDLALRRGRTNLPYRLLPPRS
jgi:hypothetical protein